MKYKKGERLRVIKQLYGHGFNIGESVEVVSVDEACMDYEVNNGNQIWTVNDEEVEPLTNTDKQ